MIKRHFATKSLVITIHYLLNQDVSQPTVTSVERQIQLHLELFRAAMKLNPRQQRAGNPVQWVPHHPVP
ncbi:unnamed protein product, partial [Iphiclides podalirius]